MHSKMTLASLALAGLLLTAGCSTGPSPGSAAATSPDDTADRTVQVAATGQTETEPNRAVLRVAVTAHGDEVDTVRERLATNASRMRTALREVGIDDGQIRTERYDIDQNYRREERASGPRYRGRHSYQITLADTDRAGSVVVTAVENGASRIEGIRFTISDEKRSQLREQAVEDAVETARGQAEAAAGGAGLVVTDARTVRTGELRTEPYRVQETAALAADGGSGGGPSFAGGSVTVTARVLVTYNATSE